jgi:tRNA 2-thiouridine synthesizing protein A
MAEAAYDAMIDARGLSCPLPLVKARQALMVLSKGARVCVLATDPAAPRDFQEFAEITGHELAEHRVENGIHKLVVVKGG